MPGTAQAAETCLTRKMGCAPKYGAYRQHCRAESTYKVGTREGVIEGRASGLSRTGRPWREEGRGIASAGQSMCRGLEAERHREAGPGGAGPGHRAEESE